MTHIAQMSFACARYARRTELKKAGLPEGYCARQHKLHKKRSQRYTLGMKTSHPRRALRRFKPDVVRHVVAFMLQHVKPTSWGHKIVHYGNGQSKTLPMLTRTKTPANLFRLYTALWKTLHGGATVSPSRDLFYRIVAALTSGNMQMQSAVDYTIGHLVSDPAKMVARIISDFVPSCDQDKWERYQWVLKNFLKHQFNFHLLIGDGCATHDLAYALDPGQRGRAEMDCSACKFFIWFYWQLKCAVDDFPDAGMRAGVRRDEVLQVLRDCQHKNKLFLMHRARVVNQQAAIKALKQRLLLKCAERYAEASSC